MSTLVRPLPSPALRTLTAADLRRAAPSIYATHPRPGVSARYAFASTAEVVDLFHATGWEPVRVQEQRVRLDARRGFQLHEIRFARALDLSTGFLQLGDTHPELVLQNAHDGSRAYRIDAGLYRLVCHNGLVVADTTFSRVSVRHADVAPAQFIRAAHAVAHSTPEVMRTVAAWRAIPLSAARRREFAGHARTLRWPEANPVAQHLTADRLLTPRRDRDHEKDLWTTFNVVQEHLLRGGDTYHRTDGERRLRADRTRPVGSIAAAQGLNKSLWALAHAFARS